MVRRFFIYGLLGWTMEIIWTGLGALLSGNLAMPAFTYLWMFPIYGAGVFLEALHDKIRPWSWILRGFIWVAAIFFLEYASGLLLASLLGSCPWDYSAVSPYHIRGLIRLDYAPVWFAVGLGYEQIHDLLDRLRV